MVLGGGREEREREVGGGGGGGKERARGRREEGGGKERAVGRMEGGQRYRLVLFIPPFLCLGFYIIQLYILSTLGLWCEVGVCEVCTFVRCT